MSSLNNRQVSWSKVEVMDGEIGLAADFLGLGYSLYGLVFFTVFYVVMLLITLVNAPIAFFVNLFDSERP